MLTRVRLFFLVQSFLQLIFLVGLLLRSNIVKANLHTYHPQWTHAHLQSYLAWVGESSLATMIVLAWLLWLARRIHRIGITALLLLQFGSLAVTFFLASLAGKLSIVLLMTQVMFALAGLGTLAWLWWEPWRNRTKFDLSVDWWLLRSLRNLAVFRASPARAIGGALCVVLWLLGAAAASCFGWLWILPLKFEVVPSGLLQIVVTLSTIGIAVMLVAGWLNAKLLGDPGEKTWLSAKTAAAILLGCALSLVPWLIVLGATLHYRAYVKSWSAAWVGLDVMEVIGLAATGLLALRRHPLVTITATFTGTLLLLDAWFDFLFSSDSREWLPSIISALFLELPLSVACYSTAYVALRWVKNSSAAPESGISDTVCG